MSVYSGSGVVNIDTVCALLYFVKTGLCGKESTGTALRYEPLSAYVNVASVKV